MTAGVSPQALYVGEQIKRRRAELGLLQREVAQRLGVDPSMVALWEQNKRPVPWKRIGALNDALAWPDLPRDDTPPPRVGPGQWCRAHRRAKPCQSCASASEKQKAIWQTPRRLEQHQRAMEFRSGWTEMEDAVLRRYAGELPADALARAINAVGRMNRTPHACESRATTLGLCRLRGPDVMSRNDLVRLFGVNLVTINYWITKGMLQMEPWGKFVMTRPPQVEAFIKSYSWAVDASRMQPGQYRALLETVTRRDPWLRMREVCRVLRIDANTLGKYIRATGIEVFQRNGHHAPMLMRASVLPRLQEHAETVRTRRRFFLRDWKAARREGRAA